jgi:hypothetical protein
MPMLPLTSLIKQCWKSGSAAVDSTCCLNHTQTSSNSVLVEQDLKIHQCDIANGHPSPSAVSIPSLLTLPHLLN